MPALAPANQAFVASAMTWGSMRTGRIVAVCTLPHEILDRRERSAVDPGPLVHASRIAAKVSCLDLQDGYQISEKKRAGVRRPSF